MLYLFLSTSRLQLLHFFKCFSCFISCFFFVSFITRQCLTSDCPYCMAYHSLFDTWKRRKPKTTNLKKLENEPKRKEREKMDNKTKKRRENNERGDERKKDL